jgi:uncharacterized integral membrane protein
MKKILASLILLLVFYHTNAQNAFLVKVFFLAGDFSDPLQRVSGDG